MGTQLDLDDLVSGYETARKELAALRKDAERYRWLRENFASVGLGGIELMWDQPDRCDALDGFVDTAMVRAPAVG